MTMTENVTRIDYGASSAKPSAEKVAMHEVRCKRRIWRREIAVECGKLLLRCEPSVLTSEYAPRVEIRCPNCGSMYTLADFKGTNA